MKDGWQTKTLGDLLDVQSGYAFRSKDYSSSGHFVMRIGNVQNGYISLADPKYINLPTDGALQRFALSEGDILVSLTGNVGRIGVISKEHLPAALNQRVARLSVREGSAVLKDFLLFFLYSELFREELIGAGHGAAQQNVSTKDLVEIELPVPPLSEQRRIVRILDEAFEGIATAKANAEKNLQNARDLFESHLQAVFTQRGEGWVETMLGELATFRNGINFTKSSRGESVRIVGVKDFKSNFWAPTEDLDTVTTDRLLPESDTLKENDILFVRSNGSIDLIGRCLLVGKRTDRVTHSGFTIRARLNKESVNPRYLCHFLKSSTTRRKMTDSGIGTNIKSLNQGTLSSLAVPVAPPAEQIRILQNLEAVEVDSQNLESVYERKLAALDELKKSLLHRAFNGQL